MRIRSRLLLLVLAVLVPSILGAAIGIAYLYHEEQKFHRESMRETARALALVLDKEFARREAILQTLAASPALDRGDIFAFYRQARQVATERDVTILLSLPDGRQVVNTRLPYGAHLPHMLPMTQELRSRQGPLATIVTNLYTPPIGGAYSFGIQIPVVRAGQVPYYIGMGSYARQLQSVFTEQNLPPDWHAGIIDRDGIIVARSKEPEKYVGKPVREDFARKLGATEGFHEGATLADLPSVAFFSRAPSSEWVFFVSVPKRVIHRPALDATLLMGAISLLLIAMSAVTALVVGRRTARPIEALRRQAERMGRNEPALLERCGVVEIDAVNSAMVLAHRDIRDARAEQEKRIAEAVASAERSQRALLQAQKLEALGRLTGGIAHDFNNLLQTVATGVELALLSCTDTRAITALESCRHAVRRAAELTGQLAVFGRVQEARLETINPSRQLAEVEPLLKSALRGDIELQLAVSPGLWPVTVDPLQFELALLNLSINARDAMPRGGTLRLEACNVTLAAPLDDLVPGDYVRLTISDNGDGMRPEVLAKALDPFFTTKSVGKGTGMGLPQAYGFAKQAGGTLMLRSVAGEGTQALLYLPKAAQVPAAPLPDKSATPQQAHGETVLLVEDDEHVRDVVQTALRDAGFRVLAAGDGEQALRLLETEEHIDLVFSDVVMPGNVSGIDLAEVIQQRFPAVRVILATGYTEHRMRLTGIRMLAKPYELSQVVNAMQDALSGRH
ncbi:hybrid sensor histidine kinase/response regulator [Noviherbaspirillum sp.]|uniref:hybrid sensor histidine kinase/response regulator n=1 Tax=Noviherbaspirillum sp. TaxID=1926288 RepID=UPI002B471BA0|nr:response regulator [Noviherbaspirillum sp.]HJV81195.1 response regulator [Noviherbaspirillum sp.]